MPPAGLLRRVREAGVMLIINMQVIAVDEDSVGVIEAAGGRKEVEKRTVVHALDSMGSMDIMVCGEGLVDLVPSEHGQLADLTPALGGGPFNVAIAAGRLGASVGFQSRLSRDAFGQALMERLHKEGVDTSLVQRGEEPTTLAVCNIGEDGSATYSFYTEGTADRLVEPVLADVPWACFGTVSLALEPGASRYAALLKEFAAKGTKVALDPNIRPFFATSEHQEFLLSLLPHITLLKLSEEEVEFLGEDALAQVPIVVTTRGAEGLSVRTDSVSLQVPPVKVEVADTIGAGDTVMAALLRQLVQRDISALGVEEWQEILHFAATAAAITVSRTGAQPPTFSEVEERL